MNSAVLINAEWTMRTFFVNELSMTEVGSTRYSCGRSRDTSNACWPIHNLKKKDPEESMQRLYNDRIEGIWRRRRNSSCVSTYTG
jgi:hypothetical protein